VKDKTENKTLVLFLGLLLTVIVGLSLVTAYYFRIISLDAHQSLFGLTIQAATGHQLNKVEDNSLFIGDALKKDKSVRSLLKKSDSNNSTKLTDLLNEQFSQRLTTSGKVKLITIHGYNKNLEFITSSTAGPSIDYVSDTRDNNLRNAKQRTGSNQFKTLAFYWSNSNDHVFHSTIFTIGGFRLAGYIEVVVDASYGLSHIEENITFPFLS